MHMHLTVGRWHAGDRSDHEQGAGLAEARKEEHVCPKFAGAHGSQECPTCQGKVKYCGQEARLPRLRPEHRAACQ